MDAARLIGPSALRPGDRVAVVTPSGPVDDERLARGAGLLEDWLPRILPGAARAVADLRGSRRRAPPAAARRLRGSRRRAVWCLAAATASTGFSRGRSGLAALGTRSSASASATRRPFSSCWCTAPESRRCTDRWSRWTSSRSWAQHARPPARHPGRRRTWRVPVPRAIVAGGASGPVCGGCLTVLASLAGTPLQPRFAGGIALLEGHRRNRSGASTACWCSSASRAMLDGVRSVFRHHADCGPPTSCAKPSRTASAILGVPIGFGAPVGLVRCTTRCRSGSPRSLRFEEAGGANDVEAGVLERQAAGGVMEFRRSEQALEEAAQRGVFPGAVLLVSRNGETLLGDAGRLPGDRGRPRADAARGRIRPVVAHQAARDHARGDDARAREAARARRPA